MSQWPFHYVDRWFKNQLQDHQAQVPGHIWRNVTHELLRNQQRKRQRRLIWFLTLPAACMLFGLGWWTGQQFSPQQITQPQTAIRLQEPIKLASSTNSFSILPEKTVSTPQTTEIIQNQPTNHLPVFSKKNTDTGLSPVTVQQIDIEPFTAIQTPIYLEENKILYPEKASEIQFFAENSIPKINHPTTPKSTIWHLGFEAGILGQMSGPDSEGHYLPVFGTGQGFSESTLPAFQMAVYTEGQRSFAQTPFSWTWRVGVQYQTLEVQTNRENLATIPFNQLQINNEKADIFTQWGKLEGLWISPNLSAVESDGPSLSTDLVLGETTQRIQQSMSWVQFPLGLGLSWQPPQQRFGYWTQIGGIAGIPIQNEVWAMGEKTSARVGHTTDLQPFRFDLQASLGISWQPTPVPLRISLGALTQWSVLNLSESDWNQIYPLQIGGKIGLQWRFK